MTLVAAAMYEVSVAREANSAWIEGRLDEIQASAYTKSQISHNISMIIIYRMYHLHTCSGLNVCNACG